MLGSGGAWGERFVYRALLEINSVGSGGLESKRGGRDCTGMGAA